MRDPVCGRCLKPRSEHYDSVYLKRDMICPGPRATGQFSAEPTPYNLARWAKNTVESFVTFEAGNYTPRQLFEVLKNEWKLQHGHEVKS